MKNMILIGALIYSTTIFAADGASLYKKCMGCHGAQAEKAALGKSKIVANMSEDEIVTAINGYKDGTYGGAMKGLMKGQVASFSQEDTKSVAAYIASLKK